jgi:hypothetical protein
MSITIPSSWLEERTVSEQIDGINTTSTFGDATLQLQTARHRLAGRARPYEDFDDHQSAM